jgi:hypothetical protein
MGYIDDSLLVADEKDDCIRKGRFYYSWQKNLLLYQFKN